MRALPRQTLVLALALCAFLLPERATAQTGPSHNHIGHVADAFRGTPDGMGLLPTAMAEAQVVAQHAGFAARDMTDLNAMKRHMGHVLNALDPAEMEDGPGLGYGVLPAINGAVRHIELAAASDGASDGVKTHSGHVATSGKNTVERAERAVALAKDIMEAESAADAAPMVEELVGLAEQLVAGLDANDDGRIGWQEGEGGIEQAQTHLTLMKRGEGIGN
jgi:hypothetical protein